MLRDKPVTCLRLQSKLTAALKQNSSLPISNLTRVKHLFKTQHCVDARYPNGSGEEDKKHQSAVYRSSESTCSWNHSFGYLPRPDPGSRVPQAIAEDAAALRATGSLFSAATSPAAVVRHIILNVGLSKPQGEIFVSAGVLNDPEEQTSDTKMLAASFRSLIFKLSPCLPPTMATALLCNGTCMNEMNLRMTPNIINKVAAFACKCCGFMEETSAIDL